MENIITDYAIFDIAKKEYIQNTKNVVPDEYGYIYRYTLEIYIERKTLPKKLIYIGNFQLKQIKNEFYIERGTRSIVLASLKNLDNNILCWYTKYNLKQFMGYTKEGNKKIYDHEVDAENFRMYLKKLGDAIEGPNGKEVLKALGIDIDQEIKEGKHLKDSLTYVGSKKEKSIKKKKS